IEVRVHALFDGVHETFELGLRLLRNSARPDDIGRLGVLGLGLQEHLGDDVVDALRAERTEPVVEHGDDAVLGHEHGAGMALVAGGLVAINAPVSHSGLSLTPGNYVALHPASAIGAQKQAPQRVTALCRGAVRAGPASWALRARPRS